MLTTIIMSLTATLSPVESVTSPNLFEANKVESNVVVESRRKSTKKLSFERTVESRRKSQKKL